MEVWSHIEGFEGLYEVSPLGRVRNARTHKVLKPRSDSDGYHLVTLWKGSPVKKYDRKVHRLVAAAFIPNVGNRPQVNHLNGVRTDNRSANLEWSTCAENIRHSFDKLARKSNTSRPIKAEKEGETLRFPSFMEAKRSGFNRNLIYACMSGLQTHHKGYKWSYVNE